MLSKWGRRALELQEIEALDADYEERAAIMEYDGGLTRQEAEALAREICAPETKNTAYS